MRNAVFIKRYGCHCIDRTKNHIANPLFIKTMIDKQKNQSQYHYTNFYKGKCAYTVAQKGVYDQK